MTKFEKLVEFLWLFVMGVALFLAAYGLGFFEKPLVEVTLAEPLRVPAPPCDEVRRFPAIDKAEEIVILVCDAR